MYKTANDVAASVIIKLAVSPELAAKALMGPAAAKRNFGAMDIKDLMDVFMNKLNRTNLRAQGVPREGMQAAKESLDSMLRDILG